MAITLEDLNKHIKNKQQRLVETEKEIVDLKHRRLALTTGLQLGDIVMDTFGTIGVLVYSSHDPDHWGWRIYDDKECRIRTAGRPKLVPADIKICTFEIPKVVKLFSNCVKGGKGFDV